MAIETWLAGKYFAAASATVFSRALLVVGSVLSATQDSGAAYAVVGWVATARPANGRASRKAVVAAVGAFSQRARRLVGRSSRSDPDPRLRSSLVVLVVPSPMLPSSRRDAWHRSLTCLEKPRVTIPRKRIGDARPVRRALRQIRSPIQHVEEQSRVVVDPAPGALSHVEGG